MIRENDQGISEENNEGSYGNEKLKAALEAIREGMPIKRASIAHGVPRRTLRRHLNNKVQTPDEISLGRHNPVLNDDAENELVEHIRVREKCLHA